MQSPDIIIRRAQLPHIVGVSLATIDRWRREASNDFPAARKLGAQAVGFLLSEVESWIASRPEAKQ